MKIILISGLSGSGKTIALNLLEDNGFFCIDNLPLELLPELIALHSHQCPVNDQIAISIDIRSNLNTHTAHETLIALRRAGHQVSLLFLEASETVLLRRFSETRRSHPLARNHITLPESLHREREWHDPLREHARSGLLHRHQPSHRPATAPPCRPMDRHRPQPPAGEHRLLRLQTQRAAARRFRV